MRRYDVFFGSVVFVAVLSVSVVLSGVVAYGGMRKGECADGPRLCPSTECEDYPGGNYASGKCTGVFLVMYCDNSSDKDCPTAFSRCSEARCYSDPNCTGIRMFPCDLPCGVCNVCADVA